MPIHPFQPDHTTLVFIISMAAVLLTGLIATILFAINQTRPLIITAALIFLLVTIAATAFSVHANMVNGTKFNNWVNKNYTLNLTQKQLNSLQHSQQGDTLNPGITILLHGKPTTLTMVTHPNGELIYANNKPLPQR